MAKLEVVCVTMNQHDFSKFREMNIASDVVFGNQAGETRKDEQKINGFSAKMITTDTRGVGINRNLALTYATGDILLFADDDIRYADGYMQGVLKAYDEHPDADMIIFSMDITKNGEVIRKIANKDGRLPAHKSLRYGACVLSARRSSLKRNNMWFSPMFGGGTEFGHGEDTLFTLEALRKSMKIYTSSFCLGTCSKDTSTCFHGYDEKYFFDQGVWYAAAFGSFAGLMALQFCVRKRKRYSQSVSFACALRNMKKGIGYFRNG